MTILTRFSMRSDWPEELRRMFPRITVSQIEAFAEIARTDRLLTDEGAPTEHMLRWLRGVAK